MPSVLSHSFDKSSHSFSTTKSLSGTCPKTKFLIPLFIVNTIDSSKLSFVFDFSTKLQDVFERNDEADEFLDVRLETGEVGAEVEVTKEILLVERNEQKALNLSIQFAQTGKTKLGAIQIRVFSCVEERSFLLYVDTPLEEKVQVLLVAVL